MPLVESQPDALARTYAASLYELSEARAGKAGVEECLGELEEILDLARGNAKFSEFMSSRSVAAEARGRSIDKIFRGVVSDTTVKFLQVLNKKGRMSHLPAIVQAFDNIVQSKLGRVEVDAYTAEPLSAEGSERLRDQLARALSREVVIHAYTEPAMIGGVKLRIGDQLVDASVATRLRRMKDQLEGQGLSRLRTKFDSIMGS
jgi:F-type H+-transporting ATPase subunit delta